MDATSSGGGPITFLPQIVSGSPEAIAAHVTRVLDKATKFVTLLDEFAKAADQLGKVWSGKASESALKKIADSLQSFEKIIKVIREGAELLGIAGTLVQTAQQAYRTVVAAVNPTVAALMSNPWTHAAAVALSTATSSSLRAFITAVGALLKTLGAVDIGEKLSTLATIIGEIDKLFGGGGTAPSTPGTPAPGAPGSASANPVPAPQAPPPVATPAGQQAIGSPGGGPGNGFTQYVPPALAGNGAGGWPLTPGGVPGTVPDPANSWIPVDPGSSWPGNASPPHQAVTLPAPSTGDLGGQDITITTSNGDVTTTIEVPAGKDIDLDLEMSIGGEHVSEHVSIDADGTVSVT